MKRNSFIYKYASIDEFTLKNLILSQLWFNPPDSMNDKLEGVVKVSNTDFKPSKKALENFILNNGLDDYYNLEYLIKNNRFLDYYMSQWFRIELNRYGISCFSNISTESLMWAHYANKHSGVCLIYDKEILLESLIEDHKTCHWTSIEYGKKPTITLIERNGQIQYSSDRPIISTKDINWKYEKELRFYLTGYNTYSFVGQSISIVHRALKGVIYGYQASEEDKDSISLILRNDPLYNDVSEYNADIDFRTGKIYIRSD